MQKKNPLNTYHLSNKESGLPNQGASVFCGHQQETIDHLLVECAVMAQLWARFIIQVGSPCAIPVGQPTLQGHWLGARNSVTKVRRKELDASVILISWTIWKERNQRIFNKVVTTCDQLLQSMLDEHCQWRLAAATSLESRSRQE